MTNLFQDLASFSSRTLDVTISHAGQEMKLSLQPLTSQQMETLRSYQSGIIPPRLPRKLQVTVERVDGLELRDMKTLADKAAFEENEIDVYDFTDSQYISAIEAARNRQNCYAFLHGVNGIYADTPGDTLEEKMAAIADILSAQLLQDVTQLILSFTPKIGEAADFLSQLGLKPSPPSDDSTDGSSPKNTEPSTDQSPPPIEANSK